VATKLDEPAPLVSSRLKATIFWLGSAPLTTRGEYTLRVGHARADMRVERIERVLDASTLDASIKAEVERHEDGDCVLALSRALAVDRHAELPSTGRFVVVDGGRIRGGGIIRDVLPDRDAWVRSKVQLRHVKWESSRIAPERRASRFGQQPALLIVTGDRDTDRKGLAKQIEERLFAAGRNVYFLGMANMLYGVDADLARADADRQEIFRRLGEVANLMLDAGLILVVSAAEVRQSDLDLLAVSMPGARIITVWLGARVTTDAACDLVVPATSDGGEASEAIAGVLQ
jgi:bifunctional enzyme CysN/CysC